MNTRFEWYPAKATTNLRKHGVSFEIAVRAFADPFALTEQDRVEAKSIDGRRSEWPTGIYCCWSPIR